MPITAAELAVKVSADTSGAEGDLKAFSGKMKGVAGGMATVGASMSLGITTPIVAMAVSAVKTAASFEKSMNVLGYVTGGTTDQMKAMSDQALQLGADTVFSANEAAEGMVELAKAGMDTEDVMGAIPGVMDLAAAGQISVSEAAELASSTLNTFGLEAEKSTQVADILAAAANASSADIRDLAFGVQNAGSVFAANGQSVETLATMVALLANNGIDASSAATSLKTMTLRLTAPTQVAAKAMQNLGLRVFDAEGNMRDYADIIADMEMLTKDLTDAQRSAAFQTIFGQDAINAANILMQEGIVGYDAMATAVEEQGAAAAMAEAQNSGLAGALDAISGSIDTVMTKVALPFLEELAGWTESLTGFVNKLGELPQPLIQAGLGFLIFAAALGPVAVGIAGIVTVLGSATLAPILLWAGGLLLVAAAVAALWAAWQMNWGDIQGKLQPAIDEVAGAAAIVQDLGRYLTTAYTEGDLFNAWLLSVPQAMLPFAEAMASAVINVKAFGEEAMATLSNLGQYFLTILAGGLALNIWLFTLPAQFAPFVLAVGEALLAVKDFATGIADAFAAIKIPDLSTLKLPNLSTLKTNLEMQLVATVKGLQLDFSGVNLNTLRDDMISGLTDAIKNFKWPEAGAIFGGTIDKLSAEIKKMDFSGIDWADMLKRAVLSPLGLAVNAAIAVTTWVISSDNFSELVTAVGDAIALIPWGDLGQAFSGLKDAVIEQLGLVVNDMITDMTALFFLAGLRIGEVGRGLSGPPSTPAAAPVAELPPVVEVKGPTEFKVDWTGMAIDFAGLLNEVSIAIDAVNWFAAGAGVRRGLETWWQIETARFASMVTTVLGAADWVGKSIQSMQAQAIGWAIKLGLAIGDALIAADMGAAILEFGAQVTQAAEDMFKGFFFGESGAATSQPGMGRTPGGGPGGGSGGVERPQEDIPGGGGARFSIRRSAEAAAMQEPLDWARYVKPLEWGGPPAGIKPLEWSQFVKPIQWLMHVPRLDWEQFATPLDWAMFVTSLIWESYISRVSWSSYISDVGWGDYINDVSWASYIPTVDWSRFIPVAPIGSNAGGTSNWRGGLTMVGESGRELVNLPRGSRVFSNNETEAMLAGSGVTINVNIASVSSDMDIHSAASRLAREFQRRMR